MKDAVGRDLKAGDRILISALVSEVYDGRAYCNLTGSSAQARKPDGAHEKFSINSAVTFRANAGDTNGDMFTQVKAPAAPVPVAADAPASAAPLAASTIPASEK